MSESSTNIVFCDWLDFTLPVDSHSLDDLYSFWLGFGFSPVAEGSFRTPLGGGSVKITKYPSVVRVSISGRSLSYLRSNNLYSSLLVWLSDNPHFITRLDAAMDLPVSGPAVIKSLIKKYKTGFARLGQRELPVSTVLSFNDSGENTGTFYVGHRTKALTTARVYDKSHEISSRGGLSNTPLTRYEMTVRGDRSKKKSPCLRDVYDPTSLFWSVASPCFLKAPRDVLPWEPNSDLTFIPDQVETTLPYVALSRFIETSGLINTLVSLSDNVGPSGKAYAFKLLSQRFVEMSEQASVDFPNSLLKNIDGTALPPD